MKKWLTYMVLLLCMGHVWGQTYHVGDLFTAPDGSQGIVYYLNPDGSGGWVVALSDASTGCYWDWGDPSDIPGLQNYTTDHPQILLNDTSGYQNTQTIRNFQNDIYSAAGIVDFDNGWVLPSPAQLRMLYAQLPFVSAALEAAGGADMADATYWTSAEKDEYFAWSVVFSTGFSGYFYANIKGTTFCRVRAVRSFTYEPTYVWSTGDTGSSITVLPEQSTAYAVTATTLIGCSDTADQTITVLHYDTTHLYEIACDSYLWYGDSLVLSGEYPHTLTATTGCDSVVTLHLTVNQSTAHTLPLTILENDLPYPFLDTTFYEAGTYVLTLENEAGCDSILTVVLNVFENVSNEVDSLICEGDLPIVWNGVEFTQAGTQPAVLTAASGADSVVLMTVTLIPTTYGTFDTAVVENELPYHFHSLTCDSVGVYVDTLDNAAGCDSVLTLTLTVWPNVTATDYDTVCQGELPFTWNDSVFTEAGTKMTTILAHTGSDSTVTMILTVIPTTYGTFDTTIVENALPLHYHNLVCDSAGIYTDTLENVAGCDSILTLNLSVWPNVTFEMDSAVCIDAFPVIWNDSVFTEAGTKTTTILAHTGADSTITMTVTVIPTTYGTVTLSVVENQLPYQYNDSIYSEGGTYTQTLMSVTGCDSVLTVVLNVFENVSNEVDSLICEGELPIVWNGVEFTQEGTQPAVLTAASGADSVVLMTVTLIPTTYGTFDTAVVENELPYHFHSLTCDSAGVYVDTLDNAAGCDSVLTLNLTVWPNVTATDYDTVCQGELPFTWNDSIFTEAGTKTTTILAHTGSDSTVTMILTVIPTTYGTFDTTIVENALPLHYHNLVCDSAGIYTDTLENVAGCDSILTLNLSVWPNVTSELDSAVCIDAFPVIWNDSVFTEAGTKTTTILAHTGADSTITMTVTVIPTTYGTLDTTVVENALPWQLHNLVCDSAGVYTDTITNAAGCDSVLTVNLMVWPNVTSELDSALCEGDFPFTWNDSVFLGADVKTTTIPAQTGADSTITMTVTVISTTYGTFDTAVVENALPWQFHNMVCDSAGVYTDTLVNAAGCDSVLTLNLTVWPNVTATDYDTVCEGDLPFTWNDSIFTEAGTKTTTILAHTGADSTVTMILTVIPTTYSTLDTAVVENALPVHYNDSTYTAEGTYIQNLTNAAGCDSILTVNLTVWPNVTAEQDFSVCETEFPFTWNDSVFTEAGVKTTIILAHTGADSTITMTVTMLSTTYGTIDTAVVENALPLHIHNLTCDSAGVYADTIANEAGCDSILTVLVTVYENVTGEDDSTVCADALPLVWNGVTFTGAGTQTAALLAHTGADSVVTMTLHVNSLSYTTIDTVTIQNNLPFHYVNGQIDTTFGVGSTMLTTSQFVFPNSNGCDSVVTLILTVYQNVATTVDTTVCAASLPYTWHGHTFTAAGSHPVTLLTSHGADSVVTYHLSVDNLAATVGNVTHVTCYGASTGAATVTATGGQTPLTCQWTNAAGTTVSTSSAISNRPAGTYTFTVTDHLGCTATATVTINTLNGELVPGTIAASQEVCDGEDIAPFTGSAASGGDNGHYQWQISTNGTDWTNAPGTSTAQGYTYPNTASNAFTLRRAWVSQSCGTVYSNEVTVSVWPNSSDTITASVCQGEVYQDNGFNVTADETAEAGEYTYEQHHATGHCDSAVILLLTVNPVAAELVEASVCEGEGYDENGFSVLPQETIGESELTRTLNLQSGQGCDSTVTLHLSVIDTSLRLVMLTEDFCEHQDASLSAVSPMPDYVWSTGETATTIVVTSPGLYSVTASEGGCSATASIRVEACHYELVLPNAITPSRGDGLNDSFYIPESYTGDMVLFTIHIYNRWGELVFHSTDKNFRWNGECRDQTQIQTVYNYVIEYTDSSGRPHRMVGSLTIL